MGPCENYGYSSVGPGWKFILQTLDCIIINTVNNAISNALYSDPNYRDPQNTLDAKVKVLQIKEKFGGLRVYIQCSGMKDVYKDYLYGACSFAEALSLKTCEKCGSIENTETRGKVGARFSRTLTLCPTHHQERDSLSSAERFLLWE